MELNKNNGLNEPLLLHDEDSDNEEFHDAVYSPSASISSVLYQPNSPPAATAMITNISTESLDASSSKEPLQPTKTAISPDTSFYGKASQLSTGMLFGPSPRGIVDAIPDPSKPCLLFSDFCPFAACAHIALLEKECEAFPNVLPTTPQLFTVVHVCETLAKHGDSGSRLLKKISGKDNNTINNGNSDNIGNQNEMTIPVLLHEGNILREKGVGISKNEPTFGGGCMLLPGYIDGAIGTKKDSLKPIDSVTLYNMNLFVQRHAPISSLFHQILTSQNPNKRTQLSTKLLNLLKTIDADLQTFNGPYLCGEQFTLADIYIYPFIERIVVVLSAYRNFWIPPSLTHLIAWYDTVSDRPSVRVATADRNEESMNSYCYERRDRREYLVEVYECYSRHEETIFQELNDSRGSAGFNVYRDYVDEETKDRKMCEIKNCQNCVIS